jgi:hypothetical protein
MSTETRQGNDYEWDRLNDPVMHARVAAAIRLAFDHADPYAIDTPAPRDGSECREIAFDTNGTAPYGFFLYEGVSPGRECPFLRADHVRRSDGLMSTVVAYDDGRTVLFSDNLGVMVEEAVAGLERFAQHVKEAGR